LPEFEWNVNPPKAPSVAQWQAFVKGGTAVCREI
jgi:hypothetical protein